MLLRRRVSFKIFSISSSSSSLNQLQLYYTQNFKSSLTQHDDLSIRSSLANIKNFAKAGCFEDALHLYHLVRASNMNATHLPFVYVLKACGGLCSIHEGLSIHGIIIKAGLGQNVTFMNSLIEMYTAFGHLNSAFHVFETMPQRNLVSWNMMVLGYSTCSQPLAALQLCVVMKNNGICLDAVGLKIVLPICGQVEALQVGKSIHGRLVITGLYNTTALATATMDMYAKCGQVGAATKVFDEIPTKDVVSWNALMTGYIKSRKFEALFLVLYQMFAQGIKPSITTFLLALQACTHLLALQVGKTIHGHIISTGIYVDISVKGLLVDLYCKCGELGFACQAFTEIIYGKVNTWSCMINGLGIHGFARESIMLFFLMLKQGIKPDEVCFLVVLSSCSHQGLTQEGWKVFLLHGITFFY
ncbi:hypothetical protein HPP92_008312 [Vanilla planifolia]|uniref:Pentatricopeptide repeat-containing protein n=1 Tax=Vanilla planifolia TaxID=51239 RepID=A0A835V5J7_VANPL|nr:hypothetical protein HPP92_008312 [Vanilla planifolia]